MSHPSSSATADIESSVVKEAIMWMVRLQSGHANDATREACRAWRMEKREHELAWQRVQGLGRDLDQSFKSLPDSDVAFEVLQVAARRMQRRQALKLLSLALAVGVTAGTGRDLVPWQAWSADYATGKGERREFAMSDGTVLLLNSDSAVDVRFSESQRLIELLRGEILLISGHDGQAPTYRPLRVATRHALFEALGTRFIVRQAPESTWLTVEEGAVAIRPESAGSSVAQAGQSYIVTRTGVARNDATDMEVGAWADGFIVARDMRLADFLDEVSRYRTGYLRCEEKISDLRLSGVFQIDDTDKLLAILPRTLPVRVDYRTRWWVTVAGK